MDSSFRAMRAVGVKSDLTSKNISLKLSTDFWDLIDTKK